jgi:menaquinone-dependent protoporphyrinogen oxidase
MDGPVLVAYASKHGSTREVAEAICGALQAARCRAHLRPASEIRDLDGYGAVVLGGSIYMGRWHRSAHAFLRRHRRALAETPLAVFALGPTPRGPVDFDSARAQLDGALAKHDVEPVLVEVFGGRIDPERFVFPLSKMPAEDARDWEVIAAWAEALPEALERAPAPAVA